MQTKKYDRLDFNVSDDVEFVRIIRPDGNTDTVHPFKYQPIEISYNEEGMETVKAVGNTEMRCRYTPDFLGEAIVEFNGTNVYTEKLKVLDSSEHGYVELSKHSKKYFSYSDGTPFFVIGINTAFPTAYGQASGAEFGLSKAYGFIGLKQYERWFKRLAENGVNLARVWFGHEYFNPDTEQIYQLDYAQFSKIDKLVELARKYSIKLKITFEQYRFFDYQRVAESSSYDDDVFRKFNKRLYDGEVRCENATEWLSEQRWKDAWLFKVKEFAKRYSGDTTISIVELWNEMNCMQSDLKTITAWGEEILPIVKELFPKHMVCSSSLTLRNDDVNNIYNNFCICEDDLVQKHWYLDQGCDIAECREGMLDVVKDAFNRIKADKPILLAETGAVNNCHTGPFRFYVNDDRGIFFADSVYTPVFLESAGTGNIWHWDDRYVEFKNLYSMFKPIEKLVSDVDFCNEDFVSMDLSNQDVSLFILKGKTVALGYLRNKSDNWKNTLRDLNPVKPIENFEFKLDGALNISCIPIWQDDRTTAELKNGIISFKNIDYGTLFKINF